MLGFHCLGAAPLGESIETKGGFSINPDGTFTLTNVDHTNSSDNSSTINAAIYSIWNNYGGGIVWFPRPGYYLASTIISRGSITLRGHGRKNTTIGSTARDQNVIVFDSSCDDAGLRDMWVIGRYGSGSNLVSSAVTVADNVPVILRDAYIWGGRSAIKMRGMDGEIDNCFINGWEFASVESYGANWYRRCKIDTSGNSVQNAFYQGSPIIPEQVMENSFDQCDFSGSFQAALTVDDGGTQTAVCGFDSCFFSSPIQIVHHRGTEFDICKFGSNTFNSPSSGTSVVGSLKYGTPLTLPAGVVKAANVNII